MFIHDPDPVLYTVLSTFLRRMPKHRLVPHRAPFATEDQMIIVHRDFFPALLVARRGAVAAWPDQLGARQLYLLSIAPRGSCQRQSMWRKRHNAGTT